MASRLAVFIFMCFPRNSNGPDIDEGNWPDLAFCVSILNKEKKHPLCLPKECADFVRGVFETERASYELLLEGESPKPETALSYHLDAVNKMLEIRVDNVGCDFAGSVAALEVLEDVDMTEVIMICLNMNDPGCPAAYHYYRERGCIFTGCLPGSLAGDYLLLQHLKGELIVEKKMVLELNYQEMMEQLLNLTSCSIP